jgi:hypothetical protein
MLIRNPKLITLRLLIITTPFLCAAVFGPVPALGQQTFESPALAAEAFVDAVATRNIYALGSILGTDWREFIPIDEISDEAVEAFIAAWNKKHRFKPIAYGKVQLAVGPEDWTLPIPIVKEGDIWRFDTIAGAEEMRTRRIGRNELSAIQAVLAYYDAQKEYALADRNGDGILEYSQKLVSSPGKRDGLYWPVMADEEESPLGPLFGTDTPGMGYHGYFYRILMGQGPNAPGGAYDYEINGRMSVGFALVAWPVDYGDSGVMTFVISHNGQVYEKDLGPDTGKVAHAMTLFDPDPSWKEVSP